LASRSGRKPRSRKKIDLRIGPALETLQKLKGPFDFVFIDADKGNYLNYYERCLKLLRRGGLIMIDNVLWSGEVANPAAKDDMTVALRGFNDRVYRDERVDLVMLPVGDGVTLARKR
jgi:predicted O-methyltransferase YrrM